MGVLLYHLGRRCGESQDQESASQHARHKNEPPRLLRRLEDLPERGPILSHIPPAANSRDAMAAISAATSFILHLLYHRLILRANANHIERTTSPCSGA